MNTFAHVIGGKVGDMVEGAVKKSLGIEDKDKNKGKKKGGIVSIFGGDKDKKEDKGGMKDKRKKEDKKDDEDKGFFSKVFHKDDDDKGKQKKSGFHGLFAEGEGGGAMTGGTMEEEAGEENEGCGGQTVAVTDRDLMDDLLAVAEETSNGN